MRGRRGDAPVSPHGRAKGDIQLKCVSCPICYNPRTTVTTTRNATDIPKTQATRRRGDPNQPRLWGPVPRDSPFDVYGPAIYHVFFLQGGIRG